MKHSGMYEYFEKHAAEYDLWHRRNRFYYMAIRHWFQYMVPKGASVFELGCADGGLCTSLDASRSAGVDLSPSLISLANSRHPEGEWSVGDVGGGIEEAAQYDYVIGSDILGYLDDIQTALENVKPLMHERSRLLLTKLNPFWNVPMRFAAWLGFAQARAYTSWLNQAQTNQLLDLSGYDVVRSGKFCLIPIWIPLVSNLVNRWVAPLPIMRRFCAVEFFVARLKNPKLPEAPPSVSVIIPARNESGNIRSALERMPQFPGKLEVVFVEGNSTDDTWEKIEECGRMSWPFEVNIMRQDGKGKGDAVRKGFASAKGDLLMILDADLTVPPEDLPRFYKVLQDRLADYVQGTRLIYPMESKAMRPLNWLGNKFFSFVFSVLLGQRFSDTLCGTKCLWKNDYEAIARNRSFFGDFDPFGDFDLIFGAAKLNLKIREVPIRYRERIYGDTNIRRFRDGWLLMRMSWFAARKIFFRKV